MIQCEETSCHLSIVIVPSSGIPQSNPEGCYLFSVGWVTFFTSWIKFLSQKDRHCLKINAVFHHILKYIYKFLNINLEMASSIPFATPFYQVHLEVLTVINFVMRNRRTLVPMRHRNKKLLNFHFRVRWWWTVWVPSISRSFTLLDRWKEGNPWA